MSTGNQNLDLLIKLLGLSTSSNDSEALLAVRKANEQVKKFNTTWEDLLRGRVTIVADPFSSLNGRPNGSTVRSTQAPPVNVARPSPPSPPRPQPAASRPYQQAQQPRPQPQPSTAAGRPNRFRARCHKCGRSLDAGMGVLGTKSDITQQWKVECNPGQCLRSPIKPKGRDAKSTDRLTDIL